MNHWWPIGGGNPTSEAQAEKNRFQPGTEVEICTGEWGPRVDGERGIILNHDEGQFCLELHKSLKLPMGTITHLWVLAHEIVPTAWL